MSYWNFAGAGAALVLSASASLANPAPVLDFAQPDSALDLVSMSSTPSYPGPSPDTWINTRFPPPSPPRLDLSAPRDDLGRQSPRYNEVLQVEGGGVGDEWDDCMNNPDNASMDYIVLLGACFCLTTNNGSDGC